VEICCEKKDGVDSIRAILGAKRVKKTPTESTTRYTHLSRSSGGKKSSTDVEKDPSIPV